MIASLIPVCSYISEKVGTQLSISSELRLSLSGSSIVFQLFYSIYMKKVFKTLTLIFYNI